MRKLVLILIAFIAVITFIRAYDNSAANYTGFISNGNFTDGKIADGVDSEAIQIVVE